MLRFLYSFLTLIFLCQPSFASEQNFQDLVALVKEGLSQAALELDDEVELGVSRVELEILVEVSTEAEGGIDLYFFVLGGTAEETTQSSVTLIYEEIVPPESSATSGTAAEVSDAVVNAARSAKEAGGLGPNLGLSAVEVELLFVVVSSGGAGFKIVFPPLSGEAGFSHAYGNTNRIKIYFRI
jgi:hypothetical protein